MSLLEERPLHCPYCGEGITVLVDASVPEQDYIEDCEVCCQPMRVSLRVGSAGEIRVRAAAENE